MRVIALTVRDFKGIRGEVSITPDPHVVVVVGKNGSGKSSLIDSIWAALGGKAACPDASVRRGAPSAACTVNLGDLVVTRKFESSGETKLFVENADGSRPRSPQALLDRLTAAGAFDPLAFASLDAREQAKTLRRLSGLDEQFREIEASAELVGRERSEVRAAIRQDEAALAGYPESEFKDVPDEAPSFADLHAEYEAMLAEKEENENIRTLARMDEERQTNCYLALGRAAAAVEEAERALALAKREREKAQAAFDEARGSAQASAAIVAELVEPDFAAIKERLARSQDVAVAVGRKRERRAILDRLSANREHMVQLGVKLDAYEKRKRRLLEESPIPVEGLDFTGDVVYLGDVPLKQVNTAMQMRIGLQVVVASNPVIRVSAIHYGSLLDDEAIEALKAWAVEQDWQFWIEMVGSGESSGGLVIEDGRLLADRSKGGGAS